MSPHYVEMKYVIGIILILSIMPILILESFATGGIDVEADKSDYFHGDIVRLLGHVKNGDSGIPVQIDISKSGTIVDSQVVFTDENGDFELVIDTSEPQWEFEVPYQVIASPVNNPNEWDPSDFYLMATPEQVALLDRTEPIVIVPKDITVDSDVPATVTFSVKAIDDRDGVLSVTCTPSSGSVFPVGKTEVFCKALDSVTNQGNGYFFVTIKAQNLNIPSWVKDVASFWVNDEIDDDGFVQVIQYLVENGVILIPNAESGEASITEIPSWIKTNAEFWVNGQITDAEFATGIEWLIQNGIIKV